MNPIALKFGEEGGVPYNELIINSDPIILPTTTPPSPMIGWQRMKLHDS